MNINLGEKIKKLRKEKDVSQEKLAKYLNVSFQAISKWENNITNPDISLLPDIARFFNITIDELLSNDKVDEEKLFYEYQSKCYNLICNGQINKTIDIWKQAYHQMPNNVQVKDMLMSAYFDTDKEKYQKEIIEIGNEIYNGNYNTYYKGQAIEMIAQTYSFTNNKEMAKKWADKAYSIIHNKEMLMMKISDDPKTILSNFAFINQIFLKRLFYMGGVLSNISSTIGGIEYTQKVDIAIAQLYDIVYPSQDMSFDDLKNMCMQHRSIAEDELSLNGDIQVIKYHLNKAMQYALKSVNVKAHFLNDPLVKKYYIEDAPQDNRVVLKTLSEELKWSIFDKIRNNDWFKQIENSLKNI